MAFGPTGKGARMGGMFAAQAAQAGMDSANKAINQGYDDALGFSKASANFLTPLYGSASAGFNAYGDRAGINGAQGQARAMEGFNNSIYGSMGRDQAANDATRRFASLGMLASGNSAFGLSDALRRNDVDNYSRYTALASPYLALAPQLGGMLASQQQGLGNLAMQRGQSLANVAQQGFQNFGNAGGAALAAGDKTREQITNLGMQGLGMFANGISAAAGGAGGLGGMFSGLFGGMSNMGGGGMPMNLRTTGGLY